MTKLSKFLSLVLRHRPEAVGLTLDSQGWVEIDALLGACNAHARALSREVLAELVANSAKQRFAISSDGRSVRASQGHSTRVDLGYEPTQPPDVLFHGTVASSLDSIRNPRQCSEAQWRAKSTAGVSASPDPCDPPRPRPA